jgi:hypothetical protein
MINQMRSEADVRLTVKTRIIRPKQMAGSELGAGAALLRRVHRGFAEYLTGNITPPKETTTERAYRRLSTSALEIDNSVQSRREGTMARIVRREIRKRGFFGWIFLILFVLFNLGMLAWLVAYWNLLAGSNAASDAERAGTIIGGTIGSGLLIFIWVAGAVILGLFAILTRGRKSIVEEYE